MKQSHEFVKSFAYVPGQLPSGKVVKVPVIPGILKHPRPDQLPDLLKKPEVLEKYTDEALRNASWQVLRQFPREWLRFSLKGARLKPTRQRALEYLLS